MKPVVSTPTESRNKEVGTFAPVNELNMYYEIHGSGEPLVLIHGGGSTIDTSFGRIIQKLKNSYRLIAVEMQAHGRTADIDRPLSFEQDADDIAALLQYLKIDKANIFGFSNGACTTLQCAIRHPEMVNKIIVASTFYKSNGTPPWFWGMMHNATFEDMPQLYKDAFLKVNPDEKGIFRMYERDITRMRSFRDITDQQMESIKAPALIITGDRDVATPEHSVEMHRILEGSRLAILPCGHGDYIGEISRPQDEFLINGTMSMIDNFLKS